MKILVIGDSGLDVFQYGTCSRLSQEAPVPIFTPNYKTTNGGMAENVYNNIKAIDPELDVELITNSVKPIKTRYIEEKSNHNLLRVDEFDEVKPCNMEAIDFSQFQCAIIIDYNKGYLTEGMINHIGKSIPLTFLDTKKKMGIWDQGITYRKVNEKEYEQTKDSCDERNLIVTLGENGCRYNGVNYPSKEKVTGADISGAGDSFLAAFAYKIITGHTESEAIKYANEISLTVIKKRGVSTI